MHCPLATADGDTATTASVRLGMRGRAITSCDGARLDDIAAPMARHG